MNLWGVMDLNGFNSELLSFLAASPSPFHAVRSLCRLLDAAGFEALDEQTDWHLQPDRGYYVVRNGSSLVAFRTAQASPLELGIRMVGAHTDSPCLRVKPKPELHQQGFFQIGVEV
ncbi:MAG: M18 family aminopeptidase, partial [Gammaproteobacteria bacterium]|nr:M18 family aminopeptidase [Gammaproteobacteria bacterium]